MDRKKLIIGGVIVAAAIGGYFYWKSTESASDKKLKPSVKKRLLKKLAPRLKSRQHAQES
jgi:hypothetical protein